MKQVLNALVVGAALAVMPTKGWASPITYTLGIGNAGISGFTGPYAEVTIDLIDASHASVEFTSLMDSAGNTYLLGNGGSAGLNVNSSSFSVVGGASGITSSNIYAGFLPGTPWDIDSGNLDGFGSFNLRVNAFDGFTHSATTILFTVQNDSGTWADSSAVLTGNANGYVAAAHIFVCGPSCTASSGALATGYATNGTDLGLTTAPEPASMALLGTGLLFTASQLRRRTGVR